MPSYYDSAANDPGKPKRDYKAAGLPRSGIRKKRRAGRRKKREDRRARWRGEYEALTPAEKKDRWASSAHTFGFSGGGVVKQGGKVENGHDITYARGSGAARPQIFRKNG